MGYQIHFNLITDLSAQSTGLMDIIGHNQFINVGLFVNWKSKDSIEIDITSCTIGITTHIFFKSTIS